MVLPIGNLQINITSKMYFENQIKKDYYTAAAEIIVGNMGHVEFAPGLYMIADKEFIKFTRHYKEYKIVDELYLFHQTFYIVNMKINRGTTD